MIEGDLVMGRSETTDCEVRARRRQEDQDYATEDIYFHGGKSMRLPIWFKIKLKWIVSVI